MPYPDARREEIVDTFFGTAVPDPYRWLEDPDSDETRSWVTAQNAITDAWLANVAARPAIRDRLRALWTFARQSAPYRRAGRYFSLYNDGTFEQAVVQVADTLDAAPRTILDPNTFSADGTASLSSWAVSKDGRYLVYGVSEAGSDWTTYRVRDLSTGADTADRVTWSKFSGPAWSPDGTGFYYCRYPQPVSGEAALRDQEVRFHTLGQSQSEDVLIHCNPDHPTQGYQATVSEDDQYLVITVWEGSAEKSRIYYRPHDQADAPLVRLLDDFDAQYTFVGNDGPRFWIATNLDAPRGRLLEIDLTRPERENWRELIAESADTIASIHAVGGFFLVDVLRDACSVLLRYGPDGTLLGEVALPGIGTVAAVSGKQGDDEAFFQFTSFTTPTETWRLDVPTGEISLFSRPKVDFDPGNFVTEQIFYDSPDGTRVPMFLTYRRGLQRDGALPTLLYGYGGFNIPITPAFSVPTAVWLELGGVFASANLRGGGEYGQDWHEAGTRTQKQNVFDDFIAAAEHLIAEGWTKPAKLAIHGRSNGGLLVGATLLQRPDLFGAAIPTVGVHDMLRYHRFTIGWAWASDYGTVDDEEVFPALLAYSPVHNCVAGDYPPVLVTTADHDDRVVPAHSYKLTAALQHAQRGEAPILARIEVQAGHGMGKSVSMQIEEKTDMWSFLAHTLEMSF